MALPRLPAERWRWFHRDPGFAAGAAEAWPFRRDSRKTGRSCRRVQHKRGIAAGEGVAIGLERPVKGKKILILAIRVRIDRDRLRIPVAAHLLRLALCVGKDHRTLPVGVGANRLCRLAAFAAVQCRLLLALATTRNRISAGSSHPTSRTELVRPSEM